MLPEDIDLSLFKDVFMESRVESSTFPTTQEISAASVTSLRLGRSAKGKSVSSYLLMLLYVF